MKAYFTRLRNRSSGSPLKRVMSRSQAISASMASEQVIGSCWVSGCSSQPRRRRQKAMMPLARNAGSCTPSAMVLPSSHQGAVLSGSCGALSWWLSSVVLVMEEHLQLTQARDGDARDDIQLSEVQALYFCECLMKLAAKLAQ
ncbi:hypothetical protein D3C77_417020 [compost metagenome]